MIGEVTTLDHELLNDSVESRSLVSEALLASAESTEVLRGFGDGLAIETNDNSSQSLITVLDVKEDLIACQLMVSLMCLDQWLVYLVGDLWALGSFGGTCEEKEARSEHEQKRNDNSL